MPFRTVRPSRRAAKHPKCLHARSFGAVELRLRMTNNAFCQPARGTPRERLRVTGLAGQGFPSLHEWVTI
jgi:hypothetical protein